MQDVEEESRRAGYRGVVVAYVELGEEAGVVLVGEREDLVQGWTGGVGEGKRAAAGGPESGISGSMGWRERTHHKRASIPGDIWGARRWYCVREPWKLMRRSSPSACGRQDGKGCCWIWHGCVVSRPPCPPTTPEADAARTDL